MEIMISPHYNPHILRVLKNFQNAAGQSLKGPSTLTQPQIQFTVSEMDDYRKSLESSVKIEDINCDTAAKENPVNQSYIQIAPVFLPMDTFTGEQTETLLEGENISCFVVGGEKRLCLPQILNTVLRKFTMEEVHEACSELHIFFSRCTPEQLQLLKLSSVLPTNAPSCGLITKTDAERLCNRLLDTVPERCGQDPPTSNSFKVYHECFGKCKGIFSPEKYTSPDSLCIECYECRGMFSPAKFVCHSHNSKENRTCHWGFDSENWRSYLLLANDQDCREPLIQCLEEMKDKFQSRNKLKRKQSSNSEDTPHKKSNNHSSNSPLEISPNARFKVHPKFRKIELPSSLDQGPPKLLNPERVVPFAEHERYGRDFVPNVSLVPATLSVNSKLPGEDDDFIEESPKLKIEESFDLDTSGSSDSESECSSSSGCIQTTIKRNSSTTVLDLSITSTSTVSHTEDPELLLLHQALDGKVGESQHGRDEFIKQFLELRESQKAQFQQLQNRNESLNKELDQVRSSKKHKLEELQETSRDLKREVNRLTLEKDVWSKEAAEERLRHNREIEDIIKAHAEELAKVKAKYKSQVEKARTRVNQYEQVYVQMNQEVVYLRGELNKQGKEVVDIKYNIATTSSPVPVLSAVLSSSSNAALHAAGAQSADGEKG